MGLWIIVFVALIAFEGIMYAIPENVTLIYKTLDGETSETIKTRTRTVGELREELIEKGYDISDIDGCVPGEDTAISNNMIVSVYRASEAVAEIGGEERTLYIIPGTVEENLAFNNIAYDDDDEISPALDKTVDADTKIVVDEVHYKVKEKTEKVAATDKVILDPTLTSGVQEKSEGNDGEGIFTYTTKYVNGKKTGTDKAVKEWITEPHDNTLRLGTSATGHTGEFIVTRTFTANCTAYTARVGAHGSLGETVKRGTCAVDPSYVPYRSQLWIEGYGYAYANDCGSAVKGNVVDLFMTSTAQCIQWGRRNMTAYILQPVE